MSLSNIPAGKKEEMAVRRAKALELRIAGMHYRAIAAELGVNVMTVHRDVKHELAKIEAHAAELRPEVLRLELERLDELFNVHWCEATNEDASPVNRTAATDRCIKIMERRAKLLGLDAPERFEIDLTNAREDQLEALAQGRRPPL